MITLLECPEDIITIPFILLSGTENPYDTVWHSVEDFKFQNQLGRTVSMADLPGKVIVADFFFTRCPSICPKLTANIRKLQDALSTKDQFKQLNPAFVQFISFSVDPERDSVPVLKAYGDQFGINPDLWWLLTGPKKQIYDFSINELKLGLADGEGVDSNFIHTQKLVLLDKQQVVRGYYNGLDSIDMTGWRMIWSLSCWKKIKTMCLL